MQMQPENKPREKLGSWGSSPGRGALYEGLYLRFVLNHDLGIAKNGLGCTYVGSPLWCQACLLFYVELCESGYQSEQSRTLALPRPPAPNPPHPALLLSNLLDPCCCPYLTPPCSRTEEWTTWSKPRSDPSLALVFPHALLRKHLSDQQIRAWLDRRGAVKEWWRRRKVG